MLVPELSSSSNESLQFGVIECSPHDVLQKRPTVSMDDVANGLPIEVYRLPSNACRVNSSERGMGVSGFPPTLMTDSREIHILWHINWVVDRVYLTYPI